MATRRLFSYLAAGMLLFGAGTGSADLVDIIEVGRTGSGAAGGTATFKVYLNSGTADVGGGQLYYNFDDFAQWDQGSSSLTGFHTSFPGFWSPANGFPGSQADLQIAGAQFSMPPVPINQIWAEFTVAWLPGTSSLNLLVLSTPASQIVDGASMPIPGIIPAIIPIVTGQAPEPGALVLLGLSLAGLAFIRRR